MTDAAPEDFVDFLRCLVAAECDFLVVGAHALAVHGSPRATGDLDVLVRADADNAPRVLAALREFGAPLAMHGITERDFRVPGLVYQMGLPPRRIDVLTQITGVSFDDATVGAVTGSIGGVSIRCIGLEAMLKNKLAAGRAKDLADAEILRQLRDRSPA
ncbi:MAG: nucleotidyltransferase [Nannocystaceae bacterium]|nr:nucleotidyltransferase [Nannocystaceae bacterium]